MARGDGAAQGVAVTIGTFDGVHVGHRLLIESTRRQGGGRAVVVVTFDRHPLETIRPQVAPRLLTGLRHKLELLDEAGADETVVLVFDAARSRQAAEEFVEAFLVGELGAGAVVVGEGFRFGHDQGGDVDLLRSMGEQLGFDVVTVPLVGAGTDTGAVSSSSVRKAVAAGRLAEAAAALGRDHEVRGALEGGVVAVGGRLLLPPAGRYLADLVVDGQARRLVVRVEAEGAVVLEGGGADGEAEAEVGLRFHTPLGADRSPAPVAGEVRH